MLDGVVEGCWKVAALREDHKEVTLGHVELGVFAMTESPRSVDDLIEDGLEPFGASNRAEHAAQRTLLCAQVLNFAGQL